MTVCYPKQGASFERSLLAKKRICSQRGLKQIVSWLRIVNLRKRGLLIKERICSLRELILSFKSSPPMRRQADYISVSVISLDGYPFPLR